LRDLPRNSVEMPSESIVFVHYSRHQDVRTT